MDGWCLEGLTVNGDSTLLPMLRFPFVVGRDPSYDLAIASAETSRQHAPASSSGTSAACCG